MQLTLSLRPALLELSDALAPVCSDRPQTSGTFVGRVVRLARALHALGVGAGSRVAILEYRSDRYAEYAYAIWWIGAVVIAMNVRWSEDALTERLDDCGGDSVAGRGWFS